MDNNVIYLRANTRKSNSKHPDWVGEGSYKLEDVTCAAWVKEGRNGKWMSITLSGKPTPQHKYGEKLLQAGLFKNTSKKPDDDVTVPDYTGKEFIEKGSDDPYTVLEGFIERDSDNKVTVRVVLMPPIPPEEIDGEPVTAKEIDADDIPF